MKTKHSFILAIAGIVLLTLSTSISLRASEVSDSVESQASTGVTSSLRFTFSTALKNDGVQPFSSGRLSGQYILSSTQNSQQLSITLNNLKFSAPYQLNALFGYSTDVTNAATLTSDDKGKFKSTYSINKGVVSRNRTAFPAMLGSFNNVRELQFSSAGQTILHADLTHADRLGYQFSGPLTNTGVIPAAYGVVRINANAKASQFVFHVAGLPVNTDYALSINAVVVQKVTSDRNGRLNVRKLLGNAENSIFVHTVSLLNSAGNVVILTIKGMGIPPDNTVPAVIATTPVNLATLVPTNARIGVTFNKPIVTDLVTTANFLVTGPGTTPVAGLISYDDVSGIFIFNHAALLASNTLYTATLTTGIQGFAGNTMTTPYTWTFTTGTTADTTPPLVIATTPLNLAGNVVLNSSLTATFSKAMIAATINSKSFVVQQGTTPVLGTVSYTGVTATFKPTTALLSNTVYYATITTAVTDLAGNAKVTPYNWSFTTGTIPDTTPPTVTSVSPLDLSINVPVNSQVTVIFSEALLSSSIIPAGFTLAQGGTSVLGSVSYSGLTATFTPTVSLTSNTLYTATLTTAVTDLAGNPLASTYTWSFTAVLVPDTTPPTVTSVSPLNNAINVPINTLVTATFSEAMLFGTISTTSFTLAQGLTPITGAVSYSGLTATFTPTVALTSNTLYTATITTAVTDLAGNPLAIAYTWSFTAVLVPDTTPPTVTSVSPLNNAINVPINTLVTATFSEAMLIGTISSTSFTLKQGLTPIAGTVSYSGLIATFNSTVDLAVSTLYTATVTTAVTDLAGNPLAITYTWSFTTGTLSQGSPKPIVLGSAGSFTTLAGSTVTSVGPTQLNGDLGVSPGSAVTGFPPGNITGSTHAGDGTAATAKNDLLAAYNDGAARLGAATLPGNLGGLTFTPGLYKNASSTGISGTGPNAILTLDAQGDANAVFIFQMASTLITDSGTQVVLSGGAKAANVYWQVGSSATIGTTCIFKGNILADQSITLTTGATLEGRALTRIGAVTLDSNIITVPAP